MENIVNSIETLLDNASNYGKTSYDLAKLKIIDKTSDVVSPIIPKAIAYIILMTFLLFTSLGVAFYLGEIFENISYGFFAVGAFYGIIGIIVRVFMHGWIKKKISDYIIKQALK